MLLPVATTPPAFRHRISLTVQYIGSYRIPPKKTGRPGNGEEGEDALKFNPDL